MFHTDVGVNNGGDCVQKDKVKGEFLYYVVHYDIKCQ